MVKFKWNSGEKKGGRNKAKESKSSSNVLHSDEEADRAEDDPDPSSRSYIYDEIDEFHAGREKILLEGATSQRDSDRYLDKDEVYALSADDDSLDDNDDEDEEENVHYKNLAYYQALVNKDREDLASDLEDEPEDNLPNVKAWGEDESAYYNTDFVDVDRGYFKEYEKQFADDEEKDALDMQKRMLEQLNEDDFGLDLLQNAKAEQIQHEDKTKIELDIAKMSKMEKLHVVQRESPELLSLLEDFRAKLLVIKNLIQPLIDLVNEGKIPEGPGVDYLNVKHQLLLNYCTNVCFYVTLKTKRVDTSNHPIVKRLVGYRKLMKEMEPLDVLMTDQMTAILEFQRSGKDIGVLFQEENGQHTGVKKPSETKTTTMMTTTTTKTVVALSKTVGNKKEVKDKNLSSDGKTPTVTKKKKKSVSFVQANVDDDWKAELERHSLTKLKNGQQKIYAQEDDYVDERMEAEEEDKDDDDGDDDDDMDMQEDLESDITPQPEKGRDFVGKRQITRQIQKNKGLLPYRKKIRRNPRVNNRDKYRKAKIRRKGQVQEVRRELNKYAGEKFGIRVRTSRSVRLK